MIENRFNALYLKQKQNIKNEQHSLLAIIAMFLCLAIVIVFLCYLNYQQQDFLLPKDLMDYLVNNHYGKEEHSLKFDDVLLMASKVFVCSTIFIFFFAYVCGDVRKSNWRAMLSNSSYLGLLVSVVLCLVMTSSNFLFKYTNTYSETAHSIVQHNVEQYRTNPTPENFAQIIELFKHEPNKNFYFYVKAASDNEAVDFIVPAIRDDVFHFPDDRLANAYTCRLEYNYDGRFLSTPCRNYLKKVDTSNSYSLLGIMMIAPLFVGFALFISLYFVALVRHNRLENQVKEHHYE